MPLALIERATPASALDALGNTPGVRLVLPAVLPYSPRDVAASYFHHMAEALERPTGDWLALPVWPQELPLGHRRMLWRTALALGGAVVQVQPDPNGAWAPGALRLETTGEPGRDLPGGWEGGAAALAARRSPLGWVNRGPGAGAFRPGAVLLMGERPGVARSGQLKHRLPFVSFDGAGCAGWLAEQLEAAGLAEADLYWVNAYDALGVPTDAAFIDALHPSRVVALGSTAARWCRTCGKLPHDAVPHPQYWKRFHYRDRYPLLDVLRATV